MNTKLWEVIKNSRSEIQKMTNIHLGLGLLRDEIGLGIIMHIPDFVTLNFHIPRLSCVSRNKLSGDRTTYRRWVAILKSLYKYRSVEASSE